MVYEVESVRPRDGPKKTWKEVVAKIGRSNYYARQMIWTLWNGESQLRMLYKGRVWVNEWIFFLVPVHMNHPRKGPLTYHYLFIYFFRPAPVCVLIVLEVLMAFSEHLTVESHTVFFCQQSYLLLFGIPSPTHSFFPGLKPSFSTNLSHCSPSFLST